VYHEAVSSGESFGLLTVLRGCQLLLEAKKESVACAHIEAAIQAMSQRLEATDRSLGPTQN